MKNAPKWFKEFCLAMRVFVVMNAGCLTLAVYMKDNGENVKRDVLIFLAERGIEL